MSTHQEMLAPLINVLLGESMFERCEPGSSLFIEVYQREEKVQKIVLVYAKSPEDIPIVQTISLEELTDRIQRKFQQLN